MTGGRLITVTLPAVAVLLTRPAPARGWSRRRLATAVGPPETDDMVRRRPGRLVAFGVLASCCLVALGPVVAGALFAVTAGGLMLVVRARRARQLSATRDDVVELCRAIAGELRAGRSTADAFARAAQGTPNPLRAALQGAIGIGRRGDATELADALLVAASGPGLEGLRPMVACWRVAMVSGVALAPALDRIADALQDEIEVRRDVASALAGTRSTMRLLAALPMGGLLLGTAIGARPFGFLFDSLPGLGCLVVAVGLDLAGLAWASRIARRAMCVG